MSWFGLRELFDVQGWDPVRLINAQGNGQQVTELTHGHGTCLEEVAPVKQATMMGKSCSHGHVRLCSHNGLIVNACVSELNDPDPSGSIAMRMSSLA